MNDCHADPRLPILGAHPRPISFIEAFPDVGDLLVGHPNPGILDGKLGPMRHQAAADRNCPVVGKLNRILNNVEQDLDKAVVIRVDPQLRRPLRPGCGARAVRKH